MVRLKSRQGNDGNAQIAHCADLSSCWHFNSHDDRILNLFLKFSEKISFTNFWSIIDLIGRLLAFGTRTERRLAEARKLELYPHDNLRAHVFLMKRAGRVHFNVKTS